MSIGFKTLGDLCVLQPKSKIKAGDGLDVGAYKFFTSSKIQNKFYNDYQHNKPALIFGTGGNASVHYCEEPFSTSTDCIVLYGKDETVNLKAIYRYLEGNTYILEEGFHGAGLKHISKSYLLNIAIISGVFEYQYEIVNVFDRLCSLIEKRKQQLEKLDLLVKSQFIEMFGNPEKNPYGLEKVTINDICTSIVRGPFGSALKKDYFVERGDKTYKVYEQKHAIQKSAAIGTYYINEEKFNELKRFECKPGDFLMSCSGTMGELYRLPEDSEKGIINQALCKFTLNAKILPCFFINYMRQTIGNLETKGSGIQNIAAVSYVKAMPVILPPLDKQNEFTQFVERMDKTKLTIKQSLEKLEILKKALMQKYFG